MKLSEVNLSQIISFYYVAREGSYEKASDRLFITESAVVQQVRSLETQFGMKLITVKKHQAHLTTEGERLFVYAENFVKQLAKIEDLLKNYRSKVIRIGVARILMFYIMPVLDKFNKLYPSLRLTVREGMSADLIDELVNFKHDIILVGNPHVSSYGTLPIKGSRVVTVERMVFVAGLQYALPTDTESEWETLAREPLIVPSEGSNARLVVLNEFKRRGLTPLIGMEVDNLEAAKDLARQNWGIALMFLPTVRDDIAAGKLKVIPAQGGPITIGIDILENSEIPTSTPARNFLALLKEFFGEMESF